MRAIRAIACMAVLIGGLASIERRQARERADIASVDQVDMGVVLHVVRKNPTHGERLLPRAPRMTLVQTFAFGGMCTVDGDGARYSGPSREPRVWFASERQAELVIHDDSLALWQLCEGSEGSGKTTALAQWLWMRAAEHVGEDCEIGLTAPTFARLGHVKKAIAELWSPSWYRWKERDQVYTFVVGPRVQLVSAVRRSEAGGSPIQGANWVAHAGDELQDHFEREADIEARGRTAQDGRYKRINTATPKDLTAWRDFRAAAQRKPADGTAPVWGYSKLLGLQSPFIPDQHWHNLENSGTMTRREWRRRVLAEDVGPESAVYFNWLRALQDGTPANLRAIPPGAVDISHEVLGKWGPIGMLVGHDPGKRQHVSEFLRPFRLRDQRHGLPYWFVVDEVTTPEATMDAHVKAVRARLRDQWGMNQVDRKGRPDPDSSIALVRIDPHTRSGDEHPGEDVYKIWRAHGLFAKPAAYAPGTDRPQVIKKESRLDMMNTLLAAMVANGELRRLCVAVDEDGKAAAPNLVKALETMERDAAGDAETEDKDADDLSHWPAAVGYALWQIESPRVHRLRQENAA